MESVSFVFPTRPTLKYRCRMTKLNSQQDDFRTYPVTGIWVDVHGTTGSQKEVTGTTSSGGLYCAYIHSDFTAFSFIHT